MCIFPVCPTGALIYGEEPLNEAEFECDNIVQLRRRAEEALCVSAQLQMRPVHIQRDTMETQPTVLHLHRAGNCVSNIHPSQLLGALDFGDGDDGFVFLLLGELFNLNTVAWRDGADIFSQMFVRLLICKRAALSSSYRR